MPDESEPEVLSVRCSKCKELFDYVANEKDVVIHFSRGAQSFYSTRCPECNHSIRIPIPD